MGAWKYIDNVLAIIAAIQGYLIHKDEGRLVRGIARALWEAIEETVGVQGMAGLDRLKVLAAVEALVAALGPAFGWEPEQPEDDGLPF